MLLLSHGSQLTITRMAQSLETATSLLECYGWIVLALYGPDLWLPTVRRFCQVRKETEL
jgi:hypothetical protein